MKVHGADPLSRLRDLLNRTSESEAADGTERGTNARAHVTGENDSIQLSPAAQEMQHLRDLMSETPEVREQLVSALKDEISSGRYQFDGTRLADALLSESAALAVTAHESDGDA